LGLYLVRNKQKVGRTAESKYDVSETDVSKTMCFYVSYQNRGAETCI
jgi:hypothetical protein